MITTRGYNASLPTEEVKNHLGVDTNLRQRRAEDASASFIYTVKMEIEETRTLRFSSHSFPHLLAGTFSLVSRDNCFAYFHPLARESPRVQNREKRQEHARKKGAHSREKQGHNNIIQAHDYYMHIYIYIGYTLLNIMNVECVSIDSLGVDVDGGGSGVFNAEVAELVVLYHLAAVHALEGAPLQASNSCAARRTFALH